MKLTDKQKIEYYKHKNEKNKIIREDIKRKGYIVHGARAINAHLPTYLDVHTEDYDVFTTKPKRAATVVERRLDKHYGGNYFRTEPAEHEGTFKVRSNVTEKTAADYTKPDRKVDYKEVRGVKYATLQHHKNKIKESLSNKRNEFRHKKDLEALQRIKLYESKLKAHRRQVKKQPTSFLAYLPKLKNIKNRGGY